MGRLECRICYQLLLHDKTDGNEDNPAHFNCAVNELAQNKLGCECKECLNLFNNTGNKHDSDCAVHNMPAYPNGACDCNHFTP